MYRIESTIIGVVFYWLVMGNSLKVKQEYIKTVKLAVTRKGYVRQKDLADELGYSLATVSKFLNGKSVKCSYFQEICFHLEQDWQEIADFDKSKEKDTVIDYPEEEENFIYVERPPVEENCYNTLLNPGALVVIKAPSRMGKTALIQRTFSKIRHQGYKTAYINLHMAEIADFESLEVFLKWFCISVKKALKSESRLGDCWEDGCTPKTNCKDYFEKYLLPQDNSSFVLCLDEVDRIFPYREVAAEFLGMLRAWHDEAKVTQIWKSLRLIISHSTEVFIPLNINESPFNIGLLIELGMFNQEQIHQLAQLHEVNLAKTEIQQIIDLVNGHSYLVTQIIEYLKNNPSISLETILLTAPTEAGIFRNHLRHLWNLISKYPELLEAYRKVVITPNPIVLDSLHAYQLHSMGLVLLDINGVKPSCNLYRQYFLNQFNQLNAD